MTCPPHHYRIEDPGPDVDPQAAAGRCSKCGKVKYTFVFSIPFGGWDGGSGLKRAALDNEDYDTRLADAEWIARGVDRDG
jgi:hypothetical protein